MGKVRPLAGLTPRHDGDESLSVEQLEKMSLFQSLSQQPEFPEFPGTTVLRRYRKGEVICRVGEPGHTAFYILTAQDILELRQEQLNSGASKEAARVARWKEEVKAAQQSDGSARHVATVLIGGPPQQGFFARLARATGRSTTVSQRAPLHEGELFGEMSCLYRTPRSATVVAECECYMLEVLRNIFDKMLSNRNTSFKKRIDDAYRNRVLDLQLRNMTMFRDLPSEQIENLRARVELVDLEPGEIICDEFERPDAMYIVRTGFVQALKNVTTLFGEDSIVDWQGMTAGLFAAREESPGPRRKVWDLITSTRARVAIERIARGNKATPEEGDEVLYALNDLLRQPKLHATPEFKDVVAQAGLAAEAKKLPAGVKKFVQYQTVTGFNRRLLEAIFPKILPRLNRATDAGRVLAYQSPGDIIGEIGLLTGRPRSATCVAYGHPDSKFGRVEAVRIARDLFDEIMASAPELRDRITREASERVLRTNEKMSRPRWDDTNPLVLSERFNELGLIQGQKLMVIDLDRCTRCDECVKACVNTHDDGRSRLFLDGNRFKDYRDGQLKNYLVPATCRQCKDPICLIGCPVGSIHKGDNGQVVIEDWCIGCRRCAEQCPYNAIQMHAIGVVPRASAGWRAQGVPEWDELADWQGPGTNDRNWISLRAPFTLSREFREALNYPGAVHFRHEFEVTREMIDLRGSYHLQIMSESSLIVAWINGREVARKNPGQKLTPKIDKQERWNLEATLVPESAGPGASDMFAVLKTGKNILAIGVVANTKPSQTLLEAGLYQRIRPVVPEGMSGEFTQELVMNTAVVCDMCSQSLGQQPACVNACPHGAALRVDARTTLVQRQ